MIHRERAIDIMIFYLPREVPLANCEELLPAGFWQLVRFGEIYKIRSLTDTHFTYSADNNDKLNILKNICREELIEL